MRVLVVEDEQGIREQVCARLAGEGYTVQAAVDGEEGLYYASEYPVDVAVIDLGLPKLDGLDLIRRLRGAGKTFPILILTARSRWQEKVTGLEAGADDYLAKPFHTEELLARVRALYRRGAGLASHDVDCGPLRLDTAAQSVAVNGAPVELTTFEYRILEHLVLNSGKVVTKAELAERLYPDDADRDSNVVEVLVGRLRRKLDPTGDLQPLETLRGRGYRFRLPRSA